jgi:predicted dehydrogenase
MVQAICFCYTQRMTSPKTYRIAGINFDHMHMGDLLRLTHEHPNAEIVGVADAIDAPPGRMDGTIQNFNIPADRVFTDFRRCIEETKPDIVLLCPKTGEHGDYVEWVAPYDVHVLVEKPMASSLKDADRMIRATEATGKMLVINWPLAWYPPHVTTKRLIDRGIIGEVTEVHYYDGNRGPLRHIADKVEISAEEAARQKSQAWWYQKAAGGGSLLDYLGYGVTLGTWFHNGKAPIEASLSAATMSAFPDTKRAGVPSPTRGHSNHSRSAGLSSSARRGRSAVTTTSRLSGCRQRKAPKRMTYRSTHWKPRVGTRLNILFIVSRRASRRPDHCHRTYRVSVSRL